MNVLISILGILAILYLGAGALMGWYEMSQTDDPFKVSNIFLWLPRMLNLIKF